MEFSEAAAIAINFVVAYILLFDLAAIRPGKSLLLHSAGGGVVSSFFGRIEESLCFQHLDPDGLVAQIAVDKDEIVEASSEIITIGTQYTFA